jgi:hypothetical protein
MPQRPIRQDFSDRGAQKTEAPRPQRGVTTRRDMASVQGFLDRLARAVTSGDTRTIAALWEVPAFVIGEEDAQVIRSAAEVERFFAGACEAYNARGIVDTRAEITDLDWISDNLVMVRVRWPYLDGHKQEHGEESSTYTLRRDEQGELRLRVATMRGELKAPESGTRSQN